MAHMRNILYPACRASITNICMNKTVLIIIGIVSVIAIAATAYMGTPKFLFGNVSMDEELDNEDPLAGESDSSDESFTFECTEYWWDPKPGPQQKLKYVLYKKMDKATGKVVGFDKIPPSCSNDLKNKVTPKCTTNGALSYDNVACPQGKRCAMVQYWKDDFKILVSENLECQSGGSELPLR